jgi:hypothetical protein
MWGNYQHDSTFCCQQSILKKDLFRPNAATAQTSAFIWSSCWVSRLVTGTGHKLAGLLQTRVWRHVWLGCHNTRSSRIAFSLRSVTVPCGGRPFYRTQNAHKINRILRQNHAVPTVCLQACTAVPKNLAATWRSSVVIRDISTRVLSVSSSSAWVVYTHFVFQFSSQTKVTRI